MYLKDALKRVVRICPKKKDQSLFRVVRFVARTNTEPARVYATDGVCFFSVSVEDDLVDALVPLSSLVSPMTDAGELTLERGVDGRLNLLGKQTRYQLATTDNLEYFPAFPGIPSKLVSFPWSEVSRVFHVVTKNSKGAGVAVVRFDSQYVEAFDQIRLARVDVKMGWSGFVPVRVFASWPKGVALFGCTGHHAVFQIGDELRAVNLVNNPAYPNTDKLMVPITGGGSFLVDVQELQKIVKAACIASPLDLVMLEVSAERGCLQVVACDVRGPVDTYVGWVAINALKGSPGVVTLNGGLLFQALAQCRTPKVKLTAKDNVDPLRLESGSLVECIWQSYWA